MPYLRRVSDAELVRGVIQNCFPQFKVHSISYLAEGWSSTVWEVNGSHVFRFPKRPAVHAGLRKEIRLLPELAPALPLPIPQFDFAWQGGPKYEGVFVGYPKFPGAELLPQEWAVQPVRLARQLAQFLTSLHRFPLARAVSLGMSRGDGASWREEYLALHETVQRQVGPLLDEATQVNLFRAWREFVDDVASFQFTPALIHRDLCAEHILVDAEQGRITGILDWEDAAIGDPAFDLTGLLDFGPEFMQQVWAAYDGPRDGGMLNRARFYRAIVPCHEVLFGLECGLPQHVTAGLKELLGRFGRPQ